MSSIPITISIHISLKLEIFVNVRKIQLDRERRKEHEVLYVRAYRTGYEYFKSKWENFPTFLNYLAEAIGKFMNC